MPTQKKRNKQLCPCRTKEMNITPKQNKRNKHYAHVEQKLRNKVELSRVITDKCHHSFVRGVFHSSLFFFFVCGLLSCLINSSDCIILCRMRECIMNNELESIQQKQPWDNLQYYPGICLKYEKDNENVQSEQLIIFPEIFHVGR